MRQALIVGLALMLARGAWAQFSVFAAESQSGSLGGNTSQYGKVRQYDFSGHGSAPTEAAGIPQTDVHDPIGLVWHSGKLYVSNRWGNTQGKGSVQAFDFVGGALSGGATVAEQSSAANTGFHGFNFAPNGDLYVTTVNNGTHRYRDNGLGYAEIGNVANGQVRDVWVSPDGKKMIADGVGNALHVTDITGDTFGATTDFVINGSDASHQMTYFGGSLYVTSFNANKVFKVDLDANFNPVNSTAILDVNAAIGIAFSPDGQEMFVSSHTGNLISRYLNVGGTWTGNGTIVTGHNMGYLASVPEPASMTVLGLGALAILRRRKK